MYKLTQKKKELLQTEVQYQYSRSSGPGGQKVNKTETQVEIRWKYLESQIFNQEAKECLSEKLNNKINKEGEVLLSSEKFRTRPQNQKQCFVNLCVLIEKALTREKKRKKTKPSRSSIERRIQDKKKHGEKKRNRQKF